MRLIEFAIEKDKESFSPCVILLDCNDISSIEQIPDTQEKCKIITKQKEQYIVYGTYKALTNRYFYALSKKNNIYEDDTIRPSIRVFHRHNLLEVDTAFFDSLQLKAFVFGLAPSFDLSLLPEHTLEEFQKHH